MGPNGAPGSAVTVAGGGALAWVGGGWVADGSAVVCGPTMGPYAAPGVGDGFGVDCSRSAASTGAWSATRLSDSAGSDG